MKLIKLYVIALVSLAGLSGCIKNDLATVKGTFAEFDATTWNANASGKTYPILTRVPAYGRAVNTSDPLLTKNSGTVKIRVNLVGAQRSTDTEISYSVDPASTAVAGTHYVALPGKVTIPANSSFGEINLQILSTSSAPPASVDLILVLTGGADVKPNENYKYIGLRIAQ